MLNRVLGCSRSPVTTRSRSREYALSRICKAISAVSFPEWLHILVNVGETVAAKMKGRYPKTEAWGCAFETSSVLQVEK